MDIEIKDTKFDEENKIFSLTAFFEHNKKKHEKTFNFSKNQIDTDRYKLHLKKWARTIMEDSSETKKKLESLKNTKFDDEDVS